MASHPSGPAASAIPASRGEARPLVLLAIFLMASCADLPTPHPARSQDGTALLTEAARAHGSVALDELHDVNVAYLGIWSSLIKKIQPALIDDHYRGGSEERMLLSPMAIGQEHHGDAGTKQVFRDRETTRIWRNDKPDDSAEAIAAAALVADDYRLFLLGPMLLAKTAAGAERVGSEVVNGVACDRLLVSLNPGMGYSPGDRIELYLDRTTHLTRRMRISLEGLESTGGAVAQIDLSDYVYLRGVAWPTHFIESLVRPIPGLPIHDWHLTGIDFDRGYGISDIDGLHFTGEAMRPAGRRD